MKHSELNPDEAIDRVLAGLREAEPLDGMRQRVLRAAEKRASSRRRWSLRLPITATRSWAVATFAAVAVALAVSWVIGRSYRGVPETAHGPTYRPQGKAPATEMYIASAPTSLPGPRLAARRAPVAEHPVPVESSSDEDALAISEMNAPSRPAPPLPLTRQENLLAEAVYQGRPEELASLSPAVRARQLELSKAEFHDFFDPPTSKENE